MPRDPWGGAHESRARLRLMANYLLWSYFLIFTPSIRIVSLAGLALTLPRPPANPPGIDHEEPLERPGCRLKPPSFETAGNILEKLGDGQVLRAGFLAFPAFLAEGGEGGLSTHAPGGPGNVVKPVDHRSSEHGHVVVYLKTFWDIDA